MHPILFRIPLPGWSLPLGPTFGIVFALGLLVSAFGWRRKSRELLLIGGVLGLFGALAGSVMWGERFRLGPIPVHSYGALLSVSLVAGWQLTMRLASRAGLPRRLGESWFFIAALSGLAGARLLYVLTNLGEFSSVWDVLALRRGGLTAYGGFLGGLAGSWWFLQRCGGRFWSWADVAVPALASGVLFTRIGCYLFGCDFGRPLTSSAPEWLKRLGTFPRWAEGTLAGASGSPAWLEHVTLRGLSYGAESSLPVHPTQLYEAVAGAVLLGLSLILRERSSFRGELFLGLAFGYGLLRFLIDTLRDDSERGSFGPTLVQHWFVSIPLLLLAAAFAFGPARSARSLRVRRGLQIAAFVPGLVAWLALRPSGTAQPSYVQISVSQCIAVLAALAAALSWQRVERRSRLTA